VPLGLLRAVEPTRFASGPYVVTNPLPHMPLGRGDGVFVLTRRRIDLNDTRSCTCGAC